MPAPPYRSGNWIPISPSAASFGSRSIGKCWASSHSMTCGPISVSANWRTVRRSSVCSSVARKSIRIESITRLSAVAAARRRVVPWCMPIRFRALAPMALAIVLLTASIASADITAFIGVNGTPSTRPVKGLAVGAGLLIVGFEFEYANTNEDLTNPSELAPAAAPHLHVQGGAADTVRDCRVPAVCDRRWRRVSRNALRLQRVGDERRDQRRRRCEDESRRTAAPALRLSGVDVERQRAAPHGAAVLCGSESQVLVRQTEERRRRFLCLPSFLFLISRPTPASRPCSARPAGSRCSARPSPDSRPRACSTDPVLRSGTLPRGSS